MPRRRRSSSITVNVDVDVDVSDILDDLHDDDLKTECEKRGLYVNPTRTDAEHPARAAFLAMQDWQDLESDLRSALSEGNRIHFDVVLLRMRAFAGVPHLMTAGLKKDDLSALN